MKKRQGEEKYVILQNWSTCFPYEMGITDLRFVFVDQSNMWQLGENDTTKASFTQGVSQCSP